MLNFDSSHFHVTSQSRPGKFYAIDLIQLTCDCPDFPRIQFCKHIAAVQVHFPHLCPEENTPPVTPGDTTVPSQPERAPASSYNTLRALTQENALLMQTLASEIETIDQSAEYSAMVKGARTLKYSLLAASASLQGSRALPERDIIAPNQKSWPETAAQMGVKPAKKPKTLPEERGLTAQRIGKVKSKKRTKPSGGKGL